MKYQDILPDVLAGKWVRPEEKHEWVYLDAMGMWQGQTTMTPIVIKRDLYCGDTWEVKPKPEMIYIWGFQHPTEGAFIGAGPNNLMFMTNETIFPTRLKEKYKLIPVNEDISDMIDFDGAIDLIKMVKDFLVEHRYSNIDEETRDLNISRLQVSIENLQKQ
ncbi:hypothetical protein KAR91_45735 [Candidatus Pacearchaeota archaeon]|nr:hypothetical protein [Candidatus Pacearchaeota archaeon]